MSENLLAQIWIELNLTTKDIDDRNCQFIADTEYFTITKAFIESNCRNCKLSIENIRTVLNAKLRRFRADIATQFGVDY